MRVFEPACDDSPRQRACAAARHSARASVYSAVQMDSAVQRAFVVSVDPAASDCDRTSARYGTVRAKNKGLAYIDTLAFREKAALRRCPRARCVISQSRPHAVRTVSSELSRRRRKPVEAAPTQRSTQTQPNPAPVRTTAASSTTAVKGKKPSPCPPQRKSASASCASDGSKQNSRRTRD